MGKETFWPEDQSVALSALPTTATEVEQERRQPTNLVMIPLSAQNAATISLSSVHSFPVAGERFLIIRALIENCREAPINCTQRVSSPARNPAGNSLSKRVHYRV